jgi:hypothetical protein
VGQAENTQVRVERSVRLQAAVEAAVLCELCPDITPERGVQILAEARMPGGWMPGTATARARAAEIVDDSGWRRRALVWIEGYWQSHGHGPTWRAFRDAPELWPEDVTMTVRRIALPLLARTGCLDGTKTPFGLRVREGA